MDKKEGMERVNRILRHPIYQECLEKTVRAEIDRRFCGHDMTHLLDVARLSWILNLQKGLGLEQETVYAAALLHDCGRFRQYEDKTPHELASAQIAEGILADCGFEGMKAELILDAIRSHRDKAVAQENSLWGILYTADKRSRSCFACPARTDCDWPEEKKNLTWDL